MPTVLIADDNDELLETYDIWLSEQEEWTVRTATDGDEALAQFEPSVDVAVLDRKMPNVPGDEVARHIRSTPHDCNVVIVSAYQPDEHIDEEIYDTYLRKPVRMSEMVEAIQSQLRESPPTDL